MSPRRGRRSAGFREYYSAEAARRKSRRGAHWCAGLRRLTRAGVFIRFVYHVLSSCYSKFAAAAIGGGLRNGTRRALDLAKDVEDDDAADEDEADEHDRLG